MILVGGTNGKGSTASLLAALSQASGARTALFTSPHLIRFHERFRVQGRPISDAALLDIGPAVLGAFGGDATQPTTRLPELSGDATELPTLTFFELATLIGLIAFSRARVERAVMEVGLGGRLDATNALDPRLSVITSIGLDHQQYLGDTLEAIAREKAGIMRPGRPVVIGSRRALPTLLDEAFTRGSVPWVLDQDFRLDGRTFLIADASCPLPDHPALRLQHQRDNIATALAAAFLASGGALEAHTIARALRAWRWPGRFTRHDHRLFDAAHNPDGVRALLAGLEALDIRRCVCVFAALRDKEIDAMVAELSTSERVAEIIVSPIDSPRALAPRTICERAGLPASAAAGSLEEAIARADAIVASGRASDVVVTGSIYLLGEALTALGLAEDAQSTYR